MFGLLSNLPPLSQVKFGPQIDGLGFNQHGLLKWTKVSNGQAKHDAKLSDCPIPKQDPYACATRHNL